MVSAMSGETLLNRQYQLVKEQTQSIRLDNLHLPSGMYVITVSGAGLNETKKLLIQK
jgi:hypothetical protein